MMQSSKHQSLQQQQLQQQQQQQQQQQLRQKAQFMTFASTTDEILRKYSKYPASLTLHIFENYYRFNNSQDSQIIAKDSPMIKDFLKHALKEEIPVEMCELLKDFSIKSYDGCLILQIYDHRNLNKTTNESITKQEANDPQQQQSQPQQQQIAKPKTYRTLLKPTPLSIYYDLLYHTDSALTKFTDTLSLQMESEILTLTNRKLDLSVPLNPYNYDHLKPIENEEESHRTAIDVPRRKIHQDEMVLHKTSEYEEIMLLLSNKYRRPDEAQENKLVIVNSSSTLPASSASSSVPPTTSTKPSSKEGSVGADVKRKTEKTVPANTSLTQNPVRTTGQFMRLRLIEEIRKKREAEKFQQEANIQAQANAANELPQNMPSGIPEKRFQPSNSQQQPAPKRMKKEPKKKMNMQQQDAMLPPPQQQMQQPSVQQPMQDSMQNSVHNSMQNPMQQPIQAALPQGSPQFNSNPNSQLPSANNTPMMRNSNVPYNQASPHLNNAPQHQHPQQPPPPPQQQQQQQQQQQIPQQQMPQQQQSQSAPQQSQPSSQQQLSIQQQQYQQIFQNTLTPEEQQYFKQVQSKMQILAQMSQTGIAPNGQQLTPQQKQQALQQVKVMQQQLIQKFPVYFQRLKQFQIFQQKQKQLQQEKLQATMNSNQLPNGLNQVPMQNQNQQQFNLPQQMQNQQSMNEMNGVEPKKKRAYRKKNSTSN